MVSNEGALASNAQAAQIIVGHNSKYIDVYGIATDQDLSHTLEENIMSCGAMDILISDNAHVATSQQVDHSQNYAFFAFICITFHLLYICISFAFRIAPGIDIFALHFSNISKCQINVK